MPPSSQNRLPVGVVCDDRPDACHIVSRLLTRCGYEVAGATGAYPALRALVLATSRTSRSSRSRCPA